MLPKKIIAIDDDPICILITKKLLEKSGLIGEGVSFKSFNSPREGLTHLINELSFSNGEVILILDINMPELSGFDILNEIKSEFTDNLHVFMLTSSISMAHREMANEYKLIKGYFNKPLNKESIEILKTYLSK
ncbi:response regulator [Algoriphagus formosus]|uniref:response regulator n=1 Tax=Algoriphagus formosus TaxID=2007308 RepID=UPI000C28FEA4|nr:response regulator [Algoriphagus formosus]